MLLASGNPMRVDHDGKKKKKRIVLLLAEELPAVPAVVAPLGEGEAHRAAGAAVHHLVLHPVVGRRTARLVADRPAEDSTAAVAHQDLAVVPEERREKRQKTARVKHQREGMEKKKEHGWALLLGDGEGCDLGRVSVVLAIKRRVHGEFTPEDQLALPSVA